MAVYGLFHALRREYKKYYAKVEEGKNEIVLQHSKQDYGLSRLVTTSRGLQKKVTSGISKVS